MELIPFLRSHPDLRALAVAPQTPEIAAEFRKTLKIPDDVHLRLLSDEGHRVIDRYGLLNPKKIERGLPHPTTLLLDSKGIVRWRFTETNHRVRPSIQQIEQALSELDPPQR